MVMQADGKAARKGKEQDAASVCTHVHARIQSHPWYLPETCHVQAPKTLKEEGASKSDDKGEENPPVQAGIILSQMRMCLAFSCL